ncbi:hypothetical protein ACVW01_001239 [Thermostichus sp. MS-CIW-19]
MSVSSMASISSLLRPKRPNLRHSAAGQLETGDPSATNPSLQCNAFPNHSGLSLTCAGAERQVLTRPEEVALISLHGGGSQPFLEWRPGQARLTWQVDPWGSWQVRGVVQEFHLWIGWPDLPSPGMDPVKPREPPWPHT